MSQFLGTHENRLDAKGRVSIPAGFRAELRADTGGEGPIALILRRSHKFPCIEGWPPARFAALAAPLDRLEQFSDMHDDMTTSIYADAYSVEADKEGRILLDSELVEHAGISSQVTFMGHGATFQIWEPAAAKRRKEEAAQGNRLRRSGLGIEPASAA
jgi:MraZ protein